VVVTENSKTAEAEAQVHQAMQFSEKNGAKVVVKGLHCAPARVVLGCRRLRGMCQDNVRTCDAKESSSDADVALRGNAPELAQIRNSQRRREDKNKNCSARKEVNEMLCPV
jgi:hypothetical protein